jgi:phosphoribosyl 1,2-cyclic phosphodiesterase
MGMSVKLWGIRGSLPTPQTPEDMNRKNLKLLEGYESARKKFNMSPSDYLAQLPVTEAAGFGGHTSCIEVSTVKSRIIIDGGSGLRVLGDKIMREHGALGSAKIHILMTHFHWDHLIGLPFFTPIFMPKNEIHFYAVQPELEENIHRIFSKPNFPVAFERLPAKIFFHKLEPRKPQMFDDIQVTPYKLDHPDPCWGYKVEHEGKTYSHCVDSECLRLSREQLGEDLPLYQNVDLMIFDAQYTFKEAAEKINWGHASGPVGVDLAIREKVKRVLFIHHDPAATDEKIKHAEQQTKEYYESLQQAAAAEGKKIHNFEWCFAYESMEIKL